MQGSQFSQFKRYVGLEWVLCVIFEEEKRLGEGSKVFFLGIGQGVILEKKGDFQFSSLDF